MRILVIAAAYPYRGSMVAGSFNEKSVHTLRELGEEVAVLAPRPYVPCLLASLRPRWKAYAQMDGHETRNGVPIYRPRYLQIPRVGGAFWVDRGAYLTCCHLLKTIHRRARFNAILSFDLIGAGGLAWRLGRKLGIAAGGWATGGDMRVPTHSSHGRVLVNALKHLDVVFYQSHELFERAADHLRLPLAQMSRDRHVVLPRGIMKPPVLPKGELRHRIRKEWECPDERIIFLYTGRILRQKGMFELLDALSKAVPRDPRLMCVMIGSQPAFDETIHVQRRLNEIPGLREHVKVLPSCSPEKVWEYLCAADIFVFPSHKEGMPNSLLEAMAMGVPSIAFAIPSVLEIEGGTGGLITVPPFDTNSLCEAMLRLAISPHDRQRIGGTGRTRVLNQFMIKANTTTAVAELTRVVTEKTSRSSQLPGR